MKASKLTLTSSVAKSEEKQIKSLNTQFAGILKKELNTEWRNYSNSISQVIKFLTNEGRADFLAYCEQINFSIVPTFGYDDIMKVYNKYGAFTVKSMAKINKGEIVPKVRYSANDVCQAINKSLKA